MSRLRGIYLAEHLIALHGVAADLVEGLRDTLLSKAGARLEHALFAADQRWPRAAQWRRDAQSVGEGAMARVHVGATCVHVNTPDGGCIISAEQVYGGWSVQRSAFHRTTHFSRREMLADVKAACDELGLKVQGWEDVR